MQEKASTLPPGWLATTGDEAVALLAELKRELSSTHPLHGLDIEATARASYSDDVLFKRLDMQDAWYVVHLTWERDRETTPSFPTVDYEGSFVDFVSWAHFFDPDSLE